MARVWDSILSRLPARVTVPCLLTLPVLIASVALIAVALSRGRAAARQLVFDNFASVHERIRFQLGEMLEDAGRAVALNVALLDQGALDVSDLASWQRLWYEQARVFDTLSCISWDGADGRHAWMARYPGSQRYWFALRNVVGAPDVVEQPCDADGRLLPEPRRTYAIDPRDFDPFKTGAAATQPAWCPAFEWVDEAGKPTTFALAHVRAYRDRRGQLLGVLTAQLTLYDISRFLAQVPLSPGGQAFVLDQDSQLVADSRFSPVMDAANKRLSAAHSGNRLLVQAADRLRADAVAREHLPAARRIDLALGGQPYFMLASPFEHPSGLRWTIVTAAPEGDFTAEVERARRDSLLLAAGVTVVTVLVGLVLSMFAVRPLVRLTEHVRRIGSGALDARLELRDSPEFVNISRAINAMTVDLQDHMRLRHSLALAQEVQRSLLPAAVPRWRGLDIASQSRYCDQTGGDYYDFFPVSNGSGQRLCIAVGDVMGHGVPAAMLLASARGILRSRAQATHSLAGLLKHTNHHLLRDGEEPIGRFMTMLLLSIDPAAGQMVWASAGHDLPLLYDPAQSSFPRLDGASLPLGVTQEADYEDVVHRPVRAGQVVWVGTDGVWEMRDARGEAYGRERLRRLLARQARQSASDIAAALMADLDAFRGSARQEDDVTFVVVKVL